MRGVARAAGALASRSGLCWPRAVRPPRIELIVCDAEALEGTPGWLSFTVHFSRPPGVHPIFSAGPVAMEIEFRIRDGTARGSGAKPDYSARRADLAAGVLTIPRGVYER